MFCSNCGKELPNDANFCLNCGKSLKDINHSSEEPQWESCEIRAAEESPGGFFKDAEMCFYASAIGPQGIYNAGESKRFAGEYNSVYHYYSAPWTDMSKKQKAVDALNELIDKLARNGWQSTGMNNPSIWYNYTFKRKVRKSNE